MVELARFCRTGRLVRTPLGQVYLASSTSSSAPALRLRAVVIHYSPDVPRIDDLDVPMMSPCAAP